MIKALRKFVLYLPALILIGGACSSDVEIPEAITSQEELLPENLDYNFHIKPIISDRCFKCHGPDKNKIEAGLQLTSFDAATLKLESGQKAIVPGNVDRSELVRRILSDDPEEMMPPPDSHLTLTDLEKAILIKWIEDGAKFKEHWSLAKIKKPEVPFSNQKWLAKIGLSKSEEEKLNISDAEMNFVKSDIDRFALHKMKQYGLSPSPEASKETLLRRVSMDLTGLPPSPEDVREFLKDTSRTAYEKVVDKLLASPHYGEHQAVSWLDLARYADTHGYQDDGMRNAYPYRDWVISAFNNNLPFDKFITYQLAGDLLPNPSKEMIIATSFNRQHPQSQEGGIVPEEYLNEYVADRTNTFGKGLLGLTMECARCHDHKYDPISAKDYYSLYAFFNQNKDYGEVPYNGEAAPTIMLPTKEAEDKIRFIKEKIAVNQKDLFDSKTYQAGFNAFLEKIKSDSIDEDILTKGLLVYLPFEEDKKDQYANLSKSGIKAAPSGDYDRKPAIIPGKIGNAIKLRGDCGVALVSKEDETAKETKDRFYKGLNLEKNQPFSVSFWINVTEPKTAGPVITKNNGEFEGFRGYDITLNEDQTLNVRMMYVYPSNGIEFQTTEKLSQNRWTHLTLTYDGSSKAEGLKLFIDGKPSKTTLLTDHLEKSILHGEKATNWSFMPFEIGKNFRSSIENIQIDEFRFYDRRLSTLEAEAVSRNASSVILKGGRNKLLDYYMWNYSSEFQKKFAVVSALHLEETKVVTDVPEVMVMQELPKDQSRKTFIMNRGVYDSPGEEVTAETPVKLGVLRPDYPKNRLGLAQWLLQEDNTLFARVMVNRIWISFFGNGLVKTQEDFGNQGDLPTHPELLDWLAVTFRESGWDTKAVVKRIVMSATYRQSSKTSPDVYEKDPDNKWLSRGPSYRLSSEQVRDNALKASGLLVEKVGGPSVYPYQPAGIWEALATRNAVSYEQSHGDDLYRRSMYTIWKRSSPPPMMLNFDAADRQLCTVRRQRTATPLQSLVTMNDPQFIESARVLAERTMQETKTFEDRINHIYLASVSRAPRPTEVAILRDLLKLEMEHFAAAPEDAVKLINAGEFPVATNLDKTEVAAYTIVANTVLNSDEAVIKR